MGVTSQGTTRRLGRVRWTTILGASLIAGWQVQCDSFAEGAGAGLQGPVRPPTPALGGGPSFGGFLPLAGSSFGGAGAGQGLGGLGAGGSGGSGGSGDAPSLDAGGPAPLPDAAAPLLVDGGRRCELGEVMSFGLRGGMPVQSDVFVLVPPATLVRVATLSGERGCAVELPGCGDAGAFGVAEVATLLSGPALTAAFDEGIDLYGEDRRSVGERLYSLSRFSDGAILYVGSPCGDAADCISAPPGVSAIPELLEAIAAAYDGWASASCGTGDLDGGADAGADAGAPVATPYAIPVECADRCTCPTSLRCDLSCGATSCDTDCAPGSTCHVDCSTGDCGMECLAADCSMSCAGASGCVAYCAAADCSMDCPSGDCVQYCEVGSTCEVECTGGGCHVDCEEASTCDVRCAGGGCDVECGNGSTCTVDCPSGDCTVACDLDATCL